MPFSKLRSLAGILLALTLIFSIAQPAAAQEPLFSLRLLAWSTDGSFLIGATPGQVVILPDTSTQQLQTLWLLPTNGQKPQPLAVGFAPALSPNRRFVTFTRLDAQNQPALWGVNLTTGALQKLNPDSLSAAAAPASDPAGQISISRDGQKQAIVVGELAQAELWLGETGGPAQLRLKGENEIFSDIAWRPDGQALALIRTPLGSETDSAGELWRLDLPDNTLTRLSQNNVTDRSPLWSADGSSLAIIRNEQVVVVPAAELMVEEFTLVEQLPPIPLPLGVTAQLTPPAAIRVIHRAENTCRSAVPVGQIDTIPFEEYVQRVVPHEVPSYWPAETLKAQAVAVRTYAWAKYLQDPAAAYHVTDWVNHQYMCDTTSPATNQAVNDTAGEYLAYYGSMITAMYSAENSSPTKSSLYVNYLQAIDDPVSFGKTRYGHGYGMGQWGAQRWAAQHNWSYQAILRHYYSNITLEKGNIGFAAPPNVAIVAPWSNHYLTGNNLRLLANTSDGDNSITQTNLYLSTPTGTNLLVSEPGPAQSVGYVLDVSTWAEQTLLSQTLVLTAAAVDATGRRAVSPEVVIGLDRVTPTGLLTTSATLTGTTIITDSPVLSLTLTANDDTAGVSAISMGRSDWVWEGENLTREEVGGWPVGRVISDSLALNGLAMQATVSDNPPGTWFSSEITLPAPKQYRAYFNLKVGDHTTPAEVARLEIINNETNNLIGLHRLRGTDFRASNAYQEFHVDFDYPTVAAGQQGDPITLRLVFQDTANLSLDRVIVLEYPIPFTTTPSYAYPSFRLKVIDGAGNVSGDLLVLSHSPVYLPLMIKSTPVRLPVTP
ncbi:MAG: SpoIID/LytB domain-containing protein [Anaerolineae bacterium]|nr:SpoIID/LytB domain-containing protein [Anaerolineae bacterium]